MQGKHPGVITAQLDGLAQDDEFLVRDVGLREIYGDIHDSRRHHVSRVRHRQIRYPTKLRSDRGEHGIRDRRLILKRDGRDVRQDRRYPSYDVRTGHLELRAHHLKLHVVIIIEEYRNVKVACERSSEETKLVRIHGVIGEDEHGRCGGEQVCRKRQAYSWRSSENFLCLVRGVEVLAEDKESAVRRSQVRMKEPVLRVRELTVVLDQQGEQPGRVRFCIIPAGSDGSQNAEERVIIRDDDCIGVRGAR